MAGVKIIKVFLDASVLVAASASVNGASAYILHLARQRKIKAFVSEDAVGEAVKNVNLKLAAAGKERLKTYLIKARLKLVDSPEAETIAACEKIIHFKDAPILAAAIAKRVNILLTLDRKHFLTKSVADFAKPMKIFTPGGFLRKFFR
ncbi:PIN domain-containing protein [Patescibacteria group bacterium]|nr:PIN domain-containing protein [Patescibacteria group bacterium]MBU1499451.1 PIN domain-containing protein [Patescibacteria group bacterium]